KGRNNDLLDCLACQIGERLRNAAHALFAGRPVRNACQGTIGEEGLAILRKRTDEIQACVEEPGSGRLAACRAGPSRQAGSDGARAGWRTAVEGDCAGGDPFEAPGYPTLCGGVVPVLPPDCSLTAPSCAFPEARALSAPGDDNDLLDCLRCQVEEAAIGLSRDLSGAEICCTAEGCRSVRSRASCRAAG